MLLTLEAPKEASEDTEAEKIERPPPIRWGLTASDGHHTWEG